MVVKNLEFFDKDGYNLNLNWNASLKIWEGNIFLPRVSVGLYENTSIYVVEYVGDDRSDSEIYDSDYTDDVYSYPTDETEGGNIVFQWDLANTFVDEFFMFTFDEDYELKDTSSLVHTPYDGPICETLIINRFEKYIVPLRVNRSTENIDQNDLLEIHVAFMANENSAETTYKRTLVMSYERGYEKYEIARITFFAETIEEDERLKVWNENLGYNLKPEDTIIFKHSDIHEYMSDFEMLNEKRKELMLEGHNIYPYIGSYKSILNAIKFFGYDNLNIVEYWRNINEYDSEFGKIYRTYVYSIKDKKTLSTKRKPISLNTKDFQKLSNISLVYNVNHAESVGGEKYDEYGLPNVIEDFDRSKNDDFLLTIEEALIKLFALKKKLNDEFMPGSTKITDIIGEGNYFGINLIGNNPQISTVNYIESKGDVDFTVFPDKYCYITENKDFAQYIVDNEDGDSDSDSDIINVLDTKSNDYICEKYENYYNITYDNKFDDAVKFGLRDLPEPKNIYGGVSNNSDESFCAKVILKGTFNENIDGSSIISWRIIYTTDPNKEIKEWKYYGDVKTFEDVFVQLPYLGNYDVEMTVWDVYNHCCKQYKKDAIIVEPYNIDIRGFYYDARPLPDDLKYDLFIPHEYLDNVEKDYRYYLWTANDGGIAKGIVTYKRNPMEMSVLDIVGEYIDDNINDINRESWISIVNTESDSTDILKISWMKNDQDAASYGVSEFNFANELINPPFDENDAYSPEWNADALYHVIKKNVDKMLEECLKCDSDTSDENECPNNPYDKYDVDTILYRVDRGYKEYDHLNEDIINLRPGKHYKYVRYINNAVNIKPLTWVVLGFDNTEITGRIIDSNYPKWTLTLIGDELDPDESLRTDREIATYNGLYFTHLFEEEGIYKIKLEIKDINGNMYEIEKSIVIVDKDANYEIYHTLKDEYDKYLEAKNERNLIYLN